MDDLHTLESEGSGVSFHGLYAGGAIHADDIRNCLNKKCPVQNLVTFQSQIVSQFASDKGLKVNPSKSEVVAFSNNNSEFADDLWQVCLHILLRMLSGVSLVQRYVAHSVCST